MAHPREIRQQIARVTQTRQITQAMQRIAFIKMGHARQRVQASNPYTRHLMRIVEHLVEVNSEHRPVLMERRAPAHRIGMIVVTTDKGLCGPLNNRLLHMCVTQMHSWQQAGRQVSVTAIGSRGLGVMRRAGARIVAQAINIWDAGASNHEALLGAIAVPLHQFIDQEIDELFVATNHFVNALTYEPVLARFLPFNPQLADLPPPPPGLPCAEIDYRYEPEPGVVIDTLLLRYVETVIYRAIAENAACEQCARMTAMKAATDNANQLIGELKRQYHKSRQEAITRELAEITAGADALRDQ